MLYVFLTFIIIAIYFFQVLLASHLMGKGQNTLLTLRD